MFENPLGAQPVPDATVEEQHVLVQIENIGKSVRSAMEQLLPRALIHVGRIATLRAVYQEPYDSVNTFNRVWLERDSRKIDEQIDLVADRVEVRENFRGVTTASFILASIDREGFLTRKFTRSYGPSQQKALLERTKNTLPIIRQQIAANQARHILPNSRRNG